MTQQNDGWPLGLQPFHVRVRLMENHVLTEPNAFNTLISVSPSLSSESSSDLETVSSGSFFHDKSITFGNLIGHPPQQEASNRRVHARDPNTRQSLRLPKLRTWCSCIKDENQTLDQIVAPSLGQFLEVERRADTVNRRDKLYINFMYEEFEANQTTLGMNPLFVEDHLLPPRHENPSENLNKNLTKSSSLGSKVPAMFTGICGQTK